jgi:hypothetical protein
MSTEQLPKQIVDTGFRYAYGCEIDVSPVSSEVTISAGQVRDYTNTYDIVVRDTLVISTAFAGPGGLDTGTIAANTFYAVYVLYDVSHTNPPVGLLSLVSSRSLMPSLNGVTYTSYRLLGYVKTDISSALHEMTVVGNGTTRDHFWSSAVLVLDNGPATTYSPVDLSFAVPSIIGISDAYTSHANPSISITAFVLLNAGANNTILEIQNGGSIAAGSTCSIVNPTIATMISDSIICASDYLTPGKFFLRYQNSSAGTQSSIFINSFKYSI